MKFNDIINLNNIYLYLGDMPIQRREYTKKNFIGLSLHQDNLYHIKHNINNDFPLKENSVDIVQSEDVTEHIEYSNLPQIINNIYKILKPGGLFRLSMPDYNCDILYNRSLKDDYNNIIFDSGGGGNYDSINKKVINGGHLWFPTYKNVKSVLNSTKFKNKNIKYLHYYDENNNPVTNPIDYSKGFISRTPDFDHRVKNPYRPMSIIVDCYK